MFEIIVHPQQYEIKGIIGKDYRFQQNTENNLEHFKKIIKNEINLYSQVERSFCFFPEQSVDACFYLIPTNFHPMAGIPLDYKALLAELAKTISRNILQKLTHVVILDYLGRIYNAVSVNKSKKTFFDLMYGTESLFNFVISKGNLNATQISPWGENGVGPSLMHQDSVGLRCQTDIATIFESNDRPQKNIAIMGGSFCTSVYSRVGFGFAELLQERVIREFPEKRIKIWNFSKPAAIQSSYFNFVVHTSSIEKIDTVIWIDGVNDLLRTFPCSSLGYSDIKTLFPISNGVVTGNHHRFNVQSRFDGFLAARKTFNKILDGLNIQQLNLLQPIFNKRSQRQVELHSSLPSFFFPSDLNSGIKGDSSDYIRSVPYLQAIGATKYGTQYDFLPDADDLEFWDRFHLSPTGEKCYSDQLFDYLKNHNMFD